MKKIYTSVFVLSVLFFGCSKDFLKSYDDRIIGTWQITEINKTGLGGSISSLPFREGSFSFAKDGTLTFTDPAGNIFKGTWDIQKKVINDSDNGNVYHSLHIIAVNFTTQQMLGQYYDDINFTGTNHIKAKIISGIHTYVTHLKR